MKTERFEMRANQEFLKKLDDWRRSQPDLPARAEAIRRIVDKALEADGPTLSTLLRQWFEADPERVQEFGIEPGTSPEEAVKLTLSDGYYSRAMSAISDLMGVMEDDDDPAAQQIVSLLRRVVG